MPVGNIGDAQASYGKSVNFIVSNATLSLLRDNETALGLPDNAIIVINPVGIAKSGEYIDKGIYDIGFTDSKLGVVSLLPINAVDVTNGIYEVKETDDGKILMCKLPFNDVDPTTVDIIPDDQDPVKRRISFKGAERIYDAVKDDVLKKIDDGITKLNDIIDNKESQIEAKLVLYKDVLNPTVERLDNLDKVIDRLDNIENEDKWQELENKIKAWYELDLPYITKMINELEGTKSSMQSAVNDANLKLKDAIDSILNNDRDKYLNDRLKELLDYMDKVDNLKDNTKAELHALYCSLKDKLDDTVNGQMVPLIESTLMNCLECAIKDPEPEYWGPGEAAEENRSHLIPDKMGNLPFFIALDENGEPVYPLQYALDEDGNPIPNTPASVRKYPELAANPKNSGGYTKTTSPSNWVDVKPGDPKPVEVRPENKFQKPLTDAIQNAVLSDSGLVQPVADKILNDAADALMGPPDAADGEAAKKFCEQVNKVADNKAAAALAAATAACTHYYDPMLFDAVADKNGNACLGFSAAMMNWLAEATSAIKVLGGTVSDPPESGTAEGRPMPGGEKIKTPKS